MPSVPLNEIHIAVWERTSLYQKNVVSPKVCSETTTPRRRKIVPQQSLSSSNSKSVSLPSKTRKLKDPLSLRRMGAEVVDEGVKKFEERKSNFVPETFVENNEHSTENATCKRENNVETFEPYIPRKKRSTVAGVPATNSNYPQSCPGDFAKVKDKPLCSLDENAEKSTDFLPWQDSISVQLGEKQKQAIACDNQSDSGYSSPGSNSSCTSLTLPSVIESVPNLDEFLGSLDSMDLLDFVNSEECDKTFQNIDIDDILGECRDDTLPSLLPLVTCDDLDHVLAAI